MYRQPFSPWNYTSCMRDCLSALGTSAQECHGYCSHYASMPITYTVPMTYGGMNQAVPYSSQPSYSPYSYPGTVYGNLYSSPLNDPCMKQCLKSGTSYLDCCYYCGWC
ncbi:hypothetical protein [Bacillus thuringiensis]|uniref:hypothetical protein n=1 Tax=Bacillus thuringiensis TaxID=1428 RepID=UPI0011558F86|nr:hypothetical protein [Bacillus thuringiensis]